MPIIPEYKNNGYFWTDEDGKGFTYTSDGKRRYADDLPTDNDQPEFASEGIVPRRKLVFLDDSKRTIRLKVTEENGEYVMRPVEVLPPTVIGEIPLPTRNDTAEE